MLSKYSSPLKEIKKNINNKSFIIVVINVVFSPISVAGNCAYTPPPTAPKGPLVIDKPLRVMTMNVWGQNDDSEHKCEARLKFIGEQIANAKQVARNKSAFDIVGLTEVHPDYAAITCDGESLVKGITSKGEYKGNKNRWGHPEEDHWNPLIYDGGTSLFSTRKFPWGDNHIHQYPVPKKTGTLHGFIYSTIQINSKVSIDVYVTHIHHKCDQQCRYNELKELADGIHERSANSGNPILVMGDFNIPAPDPKTNNCDKPGYNDIMALLRKPKDLWLEAHSNRKGLTHGSQRIDYMFLLTDPYFTNSPYELTLRNPEDMKVIKWEMDGYFIRINNYPYNIWQEGPFRTSDHFGIEATLEVRQRLSWASLFSAIF